MTERPNPAHESPGDPVSVVIFVAGVTMIVAILVAMAVEWNPG